MLIRLVSFSFLITSLLTVFALPVAAEDRTLVVGTRTAPPFVIEENSELTGVSIELWREVARRLDLQYKFEQRDLVSLISGLEDGSLDVSIAALTVTAEREQRVDFSHPFHTTGLAIMIPTVDKSIFSMLSGIFSWEFLVALLGLGGLLLFVGVMLWLVERKKNSAMFGGTPLEGIGASFWWAAVTMTTVGYGDKAPVTFAGRVVGLIWMFAAIILISGFTAAIATSLTISGLKSGISGPEDLPNARVVTVKNSSSAAYLKEQGIGFVAMDTLELALEHVADQKFDALVYDKPILQYWSNQRYPESTDVLGDSFRRQDYAIALQSDSALREEVNRTLLDIIAEPEWQGVLDRYLGKAVR